MQAERDLHIFVKNDRSEYILKDRFLDVGQDRRERIENDSTLTVSGDQTEEVEGDKNITVDGDFAEDIQGDTSIHNEKDLDWQVDGDARLTVTGDLHIKSKGKLILEADGGLREIRRRILRHQRRHHYDSGHADLAQLRRFGRWGRRGRPRRSRHAGRLHRSQRFAIPVARRRLPLCPTKRRRSLTRPLVALTRRPVPVVLAGNRRWIVGSFFRRRKSLRRRGIVDRHLDPDATDTDAGSSPNPLAGNPWVAQGQGILGQLSSSLQQIATQVANTVEQAVSGQGSAPPDSTDALHYAVFAG